MAQLETQVAKIEIWDPKTSNAHVFLLAQNAINGAELYVISELPLLNPAATEDTKRISLAISASLKRSYRSALSANSFENALAEINEELGKLAGLGQSNWVGKLNSIIAVKTGQTLSLSSSGKVTALLLRDGNFTAITENSGTKNPLKTYENFSVGKVSSKDTLVFSNTQLLNFLSVDKLKKILESGPLPQAAGQIMEILQDQAGPEVAFATLLLELSPSGQAVPIEPKTLSYTSRKTASDRLKKFTKKAREGLKQFPVYAKVFWGKGLQKIKPKPKPDLVETTKVNLQEAAQTSGKGSRFSWTSIKKLTTVKKFFLISIVILLVALVVNIFLTAHYKQTKQQTQATNNLRNEISKLLNDANAAYIFRDEAKAQELLNEAKSKLATANLTEAQLKNFSDIQSQIKELSNKLEHITTVSPTLLGTLSSADRLIRLPEYLATQSGGNISSYNFASNKTEESVLKSEDSIVASATVKAGLAAIYTGSELKLWNYKAGTTSGSFTENVPTEGRGVALVFYSNNRVYTVDTAQSTVVNFLVGASGFSKPIVAIKNAGDLSQTSDMAIDGNIYLYVGNTILKYTQGKLVDFNVGALSVPLGAGGKIYTSRDVINIYVLDSVNKRILVLDKKGALSATLTSDEFTNLKDFAVDEKHKIIYILNDSSLLKFGF